MNNFAGNNSYESQQIYHDDSVSADSSDTPNPSVFPPILTTNSPPPLPFYNHTNSPSPQPNISFLDTIPSHTPFTMPSYPHSERKSNGKTDQSLMVKTMKKPIPLRAIIEDGPKGLMQRSNIFSGVMCGQYVFDIDYYIKTDSDSYLNNEDESNLIIAISLKSRSRGTKRKANQSDTNSQNKKRRLNNSQSQSYSSQSNGNGHRKNNPSNDDNTCADNIEMSFIVNIAGPNDPLPFTKTYKCHFGDPDNNDNFYNNDWSVCEDSDTETTYPAICAFKTETFSDISQRIERCVNALSDDIIPKQELTLSCVLRIESFESNTKANSSFMLNRVYKRHQFKGRRVTKFVGLKNEGATCYMNSMLQTLYHIAALRRNVYKIPVGHEAEQKKKKLKMEREKMKSDKNGMECDNANDNDMDDDVSIMNASDDEDTIVRKKKYAKPPISLELQRLFYQLQTGAESNHCDEYELGKCNGSLSGIECEEDGGNESDCSVFTVESDIQFANGDNGDEDVQMSDDSYEYYSSSYGKAVSTERLIKSFGWSGSDAFVQHDVQEFLRVLMDKIEAKVKGTHAEKIVEKLFSGEYQSYVSCKNVEYESVRNEHFQDIQLTIPKSKDSGNHSSYRTRRFGSYSSEDSLKNAPDIYDCIRKFIQPETLDGNNQYYANDELKKQDADKGLRFKRFPPVLFLQLCRFEIDHYQHTSKINDPVKFYQDIDLNPFVYVESGDECNRDAPNAYYNHLPTDEDSKGEFSYQLFSVLVHSGSTYGGHYFAYINPSGNKWYKFDDETVSIVKASEATVSQYGGSSRQSAYMLVYIQKKYAKQLLQEVDENHIPLQLRKHFTAERKRAQQKQLEMLENKKKCTISYVNGHDLIYTDGDTDCKGSGANLINVLDMGMRELLSDKKVYKDTQFKEIYKDWVGETGISEEHLMVWHYTERKNKTLRTNRLITVTDDSKADDTDKYDEDQRKRHNIPTNPTEKRLGSMYTRVGDVLEKKRMFVLLDQSKIVTLPKPVKGSILIALKYFDFFDQKTYFVDWIMVDQNGGITFGDIAKYIEETLISDSKDERSYFSVLYSYLKEINEWEESNKSKEKIDKFLMFEEEAVLKNKGTRQDVLCKVEQKALGTAVDGDYFFGDIFVIQLNPTHPYWNTLKPNTNKIENIKEIMNGNDNTNDNINALSLKMRIIKNEFNMRGVYWYPLMPDFVRSQLNMTSIKMDVRDIPAWKNKWTKALEIQYKRENNMSESDTIDKETKKKLFKSKHKWQVPKESTYGMIRRRLGYYYNINPMHIEIWLPQDTYSYRNSDKWDFGSKGRGKWRQKLQNLLDKGRHDWNEVCSLKFEIQTYNMQDFDAMTKYHHSTNRYMSDNRSANFSKRIKQLAMFNFDIIAPYKHKAHGGNMTMAVCKIWTAQDLIRSILKEGIDNPIFGYTFFSDIIQYIRDNEMTDNGKDMDDISILKTLTVDRFVMCDMDGNGKVPEQYHMEGQYKMPENFSQIKYTDFRVQFLVKNDPLVIKANEVNVERESESESEVKTEADGMEVDSAANSNSKRENNTNALWVFVNPKSRNSAPVVRVVIKRGQSLRDIVMNDLVMYLKIDKSATSSKQSSVDMNGKSEVKSDEKNESEQSEDNKEEQSESDLLFEQIMSTHQFALKKPGQSNVRLNAAHMISTVNFKVYNDPKICLLIQLPQTKSKYTRNYDKPLTIMD